MICWLHLLVYTHTILQRCNHLVTFFPYLLLVMFNTASFEDVKYLCDDIYNVEMDTVDDVYNSFVNNPSFQNEYNIKQLKEMFDVFSVSKLTNESAFLALYIKFIEKYPQLHDLLPKITMPIDVDYIYTNPTYDEPIIYKQARYHSDIEFINDNSTIVGIRNGKTIFKLAISKVKSTREASVAVTSCGSFIIRGIEKFSLKVYNFDGIHHVANYMFYHQATPLAKAIQNDDMDELQRYAATHQAYDLYVNRSNEEYGKDIGALRTNPIYTAMLFSSVKCFRFLYMSGHLDNPTEDSDKYVVYSGNLEIFRILFNDKKIEDVDHICEHIIRSHNQDLLEFWIRENGKKIDYVSMVECCLRYFNYVALEYIMDNNLVSTEELIQHRNQSRWHSSYPGFNLLNFEALDKWLNHMVLIDESMFDDHFRYAIENKDRFDLITLEPMVNIPIIKEMAKKGRSVELVRFFADKVFGFGNSIVLQKSLCKCLVNASTKTNSLLVYIKELVPVNIIRKIDNIMEEALYAHKFAVLLDLDLMDYLLEVRGENCSDSFYKQYLRTCKNSRFKRSPEVQEFVEFLGNHGFHH